MPKVIFRSADGEVREVMAEVGYTVMESALANDVPGIDANCGGACACATCHVYVDAAWQAAAGEPDDMEEAMLDFVEARTAQSRLSCQIVLADALDGLCVTTPASQTLI